MSRKTLLIRVVGACIVLLVLHTIIGSLSSTAVPPASSPARTLVKPVLTERSFDRASPSLSPIEVVAPGAGAAKDVLVRPAAADTSMSSSTATVADLGTAERLSIRFQGLTELSGDYRIGSDNMVSIPVIGRIALEGLTAADLERLLTQRTARISGREAFVTVEIAEHKPVFVTGLVQRPGTAPWKPGMTVLHALTIAGSASATRTEQGTGGIPTSAAPEVENFRLRKSVLEQKRNLAAMARLTAERNSASLIELPEKLINLVGAREAQKLIDEQSVLMMSRNQSVENQKAALERAIGTSRQEFASLQTQIANIRTQLDLRKSQKEKIDGLATKGWARTDRVLEEQIRIIDLEEKAINIQVAMSRVQGTLATLERDRANLIDERRAQIDAEILKLEREIAVVDIEIEQIRYNYRLATGTELDLTAAASPVSSSDRTSVAPAFDYSIVRQRSAGIETLKADQFTRVNPGDIIVVGIR